jgi:hypothetical protein
MSSTVRSAPRVRGEDLTSDLAARRADFDREGFLIIRGVRRSRPCALRPAPCALRLRPERAWPLRRGADQEQGRVVLQGRARVPQQVVAEQFE